MEYQLPESTQTHVHRVGDAIQPSHPLSFSLTINKRLKKKDNFHEGKSQSENSTFWGKCSEKTGNDEMYTGQLRKNVGRITTTKYK